MPKKGESYLVGRMLSRLRAEGGKWVKIHGGPFQEAGISDIIGCYRGRFIAIEAKMPDGKATPLQLAFIKAVTDNKGRGGVAFSVEEALKIRDGERRSDGE